MREATKKVTFLKIWNATFKLLYQFALKIKPISASLLLIDIYWYYTCVHIFQNGIKL